MRNSARGLYLAPQTVISLIGKLRAAVRVASFLRNRAVRRATSVFPLAKVHDPVCGMEVDAESTSGRTGWQSHDARPYLNDPAH